MPFTKKFFFERLQINMKFLKKSTRYIHTYIHTYIRTYMCQFQAFLKKLTVSSENKK